MNHVHQEIDYNQVRSKRINMKEIYELVRMNQLKASQIQAKYYNKHHDINVEYSVGDLVLRRNFKLSSAPQNYSAKLAPTYVGPFRILRKLSHTIYVLEDDVGRQTTYHIKDLRPYYSGIT
uniref:Tf2-1-like SH3-like domain-containing protein n=1 Tax=Cacopsylla melanoneura TaxID=428564 RepID=A0A8D8TD96_9HEMI